MASASESREDEGDADELVEGVKSLWATHAEIPDIEKLFGL